MLKPRPLGRHGNEAVVRRPREAELIAALHRTIERGVTFPGTAEVDGPFLSEALPGRARQGAPERDPDCDHVWFRYSGRHGGHDPSR